jgi:hypothetical protein
MCIYCCEHNEGASCFYRKVRIDSSKLEVIEYVPGYGIIMPGVMTTNGVALTVYEHLSVEDRIEFLEYMNQSFIKDRYEIFLKLIKEY